MPAKLAPEPEDVPVVIDPFALGTAILGAVKALFALKDSLAKANSAQREVMADTFEAVAQCLEATSAEIRAGQYPHGRCAELSTYATALPARMKGVVPAGEAAEVAEVLQAAHTVEMLFAIRNESRGLGQLSAIQEAVGTLRALGNLLRA